MEMRSLGFFDDIGQLTSEGAFFGDISKVLS